jgi:putative transposase
MICRSGEGFELSDTLRDFKKFTSTAIVNAIADNNQESRKSWLLWLLKQKENIKFWQEGNHPEAIFTETFLLQKLNYIHMNPVRAGIVDREDAYVYSSARDYNGHKGLIALEGF